MLAQRGHIQLLRHALILFLGPPRARAGANSREMGFPRARSVRFDARASARQIRSLLTKYAPE